MAMASDLFDDGMQEKRQKAQEIFAKKLHEQLNGHINHLPDRKLCDELLDILVMRSMAYEQKSGMILTHWIRNPPDIPSIPEIEKKILHIRDQLTKSYRSTASYKEGDFNHTLRMTSPVGFGGSNKILNIIEEKKWRWEDDKLIRDPFTLLYGSNDLPEDFYKQYRSRVGSFPGLAEKDPLNRTIYPVKILVPPDVDHRDKIG